MSQPKMLFLDIETSPKLAYVWGFFKQMIGVKQVKDHGRIMSFSAIWNNDPDKNIIYYDNRQEDDTTIVQKLIRLLDEADIVVGHNVDYFDLNVINARSIVLGLNPPSPYKIIDTYKVVKKQFKFESNSLEYLTEVLPIKHKKLAHKKFPGFELWLECIKDNEEAWKEMRLYNINDTLAVRDVYEIFRPWIKNHPNMGVYNDRPVCAKCGSTHINFRGYTPANSNVSVYRKFVCMDCGGWSRTRFTEAPKEQRKVMLTNA